MPRKGSSTRKNRIIHQETNDIRVVFYPRVSTDKQENSLDAQDRSAKAYAGSRQLIIDATFPDDDSSAVKTNFLDRPKVKEMLALMRKRSIHTILILDPDRIFRSQYDFAVSYKWLKENGMTLRFIQQDIDLSTPEGSMMAQILVSFAERECKVRERRVDAALDSLRDRRISRGNHPGYGWSMTDRFARKSQSGRDLFYVAPIPAEQAVLRHILMLWEMDASHGALTRIATILNDLGIPSKMAGKPMTKHGRTFTCSGLWAPGNVRSVIEHAVPATEAELLDGMPSLEHAAATLRSASPHPQSPTCPGIANSNAGSTTPTLFH